MHHEVEILSEDRRKKAYAEVAEISVKKNSFSHKNENTGTEIVSCFFLSCLKSHKGVLALDVCLVKRKRD